MRQLFSIAAIALGAVKGSGVLLADGGLTESGQKAYRESLAAHGRAQFEDRMIELKPRVEAAPISGSHVTVSEGAAGVEVTLTTSRLLTKPSEVEVRDAPFDYVVTSVTNDGTTTTIKVKFTFPVDETNPDAPVVAQVAKGTYPFWVCEAGVEATLLPCARASVTVGGPELLASLDVFEFNDFHGRIGSTTGEEKTSLGMIYAGKLLSEREKATNHLTISVGDNIGASVFHSAMAYDNPTVAWENLLGVQASAVGNHEFDNGFDTLLTRMGESDADPQVTEKWSIPLLGGNVKYKDGMTPALDGTAVLTSVGLTPINVCVAGVVTTSTATMVSPEGIADIVFEDPVIAVKEALALFEGGIPNPVPVDPSTEDATTSTEAAAEGEADADADARRLEGVKCDAKILLVHQGAQEDDDGDKYIDDIISGTDEISRVVKAGKGFDAILTGHTHRYYNYAVLTNPSGDEGNHLRQPLVQTGCYAQRIGHLEFTFGTDPKTNERMLIDVSSDLITVTPADEVANIPTYMAKYEKVLKPMKEMLEDAINKSEEAGKEQVGRLSAALVNDSTRRNESPLADVIADAAVYSGKKRLDGKADFSFMNPGGVREVIPAGLVTYKEIFTTLPFANQLVHGRMKGKYIYDTLEFQWNSEGQSADYQGEIPPRTTVLALGVGGLEYTYDLTQPEGKRILEVRQILENGTTEVVPRDDSKEYTVIVNDFLSSGGDTFLSFTKAEIGEDGTKWTPLEPADAESLREYMAEVMCPNMATFDVETVKPRSFIAGQEDLTDKISVRSCPKKYKEDHITIHSPEGRLGPCRFFLKNKKSNQLELAATFDDIEAAQVVYVPTPEWAAVNKKRVEFALYSDLFAGNAIPSGVTGTSNVCTSGAAAAIAAATPIAAALLAYLSI